MSERLSALADRVRRLAPCHRDPERFHGEKSAIEAELRALAQEAAQGALDGRGR